MGMHAVLYRSAVPTGSTYLSLTAVPFTFDTLTNNKILMPWDGELKMATSYGLNMSAIRVQTPLLIQTGSVHLTPFGIAATAGTNPNTCDLTDTPVALRMTENIDIQASTSDAGTQTFNSILQLGDRKYSMPAGSMYNIHATGATTVTAGGWTRVPLTFDDNLPNRLFSICGMQVLSATGIIGRLNIPGYQMAPGVPCIQTIGLRPFWRQNQLAFGELGTFRNQSLPALELYSTAADTAQQVWLQIKVIG